MRQSARILVFVVLSLLFGLFADLGAADPVILNNEDVNLSELRAFDLLCKCDTGCIINTVSLSSGGSYLAVGVLIIMFIFLIERERNSGIILLETLSIPYRFLLMGLV